MTCGRWRRRLALELSNLADHFGSADSRGILITLAISHETFASIVGASRQQVTEYLNEFDREKILFREGRRIIVNPENLRKDHRDQALVVRFSGMLRYSKRESIFAPCRRQRKSDSSTASMGFDQKVE